MENEIGIEIIKEYLIKNLRFKVIGCGTYKNKFTEIALYLEDDLIDFYRIKEYIK